MIQGRFAVFFILINKALWQIYAVMFPSLKTLILDLGKVQCQGAPRIEIVGFVSCYGSCMH